MSKYHQSNTQRRGRSNSQRRSGGGGSSNGRRPNHSGGGRRQGGGNNIASATSSRNKYLEKAKDALSSGDRVSAEYFFQHADHYTRIIEAFTPEPKPVDNNKEAQKEDSLNQDSPVAGKKPKEIATPKNNESQEKPKEVVAAANDKAEEKPKDKPKSSPKNSPENSDAKTSE